MIIMIEASINLGLGQDIMYKYFDLTNIHKNV